MKMKSDVIESVQLSSIFTVDQTNMAEVILWPWSYGTEHEKCPKNNKDKISGHNLINLNLNISVCISVLRAYQGCKLQTFMYCPVTKQSFQTLITSHETSQSANLTVADWVNLHW